MSDFDLPFALSISVSIIAVILTYLDMRRRLKQEREFSQSMAELIKTLKEELALFRGQSSDIERQKVLAEKEEKQYQRMKDFAKAVGWILEHAEDEEEE